MNDVLNTILKSTCSGKSNWHIGEIWHIGRTDYEIISWFEQNGERYYIGVVMEKNGFKKKVWREYREPDVTTYAIGGGFFIEVTADEYWLVDNCSDSNDYYTSNWITKVEYVHKLQHLMRDLEIEKGDCIMKHYIGDIKLDPNTIFVFGSNPEGIHGAGSAKVARLHFGAMYGIGEGMQCHAYALPTKDLRVKENNGYRSISKEQIIENIKKLYKYANEHPNLDFKIAYRNVVNPSLNGYTGIEMIKMFDEAGEIPKNVWFSQEWYDYYYRFLHNEGQLFEDWK